MRTGSEAAIPMHEFLLELSTFHVVGIVTDDALFQQLLDLSFLLRIVHFLDVDRHPAVLGPEMFPHPGLARFHVATIAARVRLVVYLAHQVVLHVGSNVRHQVAYVALVKCSSRYPRQF